MCEVVAMVKQLGIPMTLSFADLRWPELFPIIIPRIQGRDISEGEVDALSYDGQEN